MEQTEDRNKYQIIRKDARGCFVESQSDWFPHHKVHLQFVTYDSAKPAGSRYTNNINIYISIAEFLLLSTSAQNGYLHMALTRFKQSPTADAKPVYECLGGTSAERLKQYGQARPDGKSLSRVAKLIYGKNSDYLFVADSGPGEADAKGLIVPRFGRNPENHVNVPLSENSLHELLLMTQLHYQAWLTGQYALLAGAHPAENGKVDGKVNGRFDGKKNGRIPADDTQMF